MDLSPIRQRHIALMQTTLAILGNVLAPVSQAVATTLRDGHDGPKGWTVIEVVCHLRDFDGFFQQRAQMILAEEYPKLPAYDHEALAVERAYIDQDLHAVYAALTVSRQQYVEFFKGLSAEQWERAGVHPERGHFSLTDAVMQVGSHDCIHLEQITRILNGG